ncbi:unnamed protein product [Durusdinium trenchii]|uniref:Uncharacterized protein n=1 Tax=Durusdinium trenchii TaxID=1381693 RepID=A0ABP0LZC2_9DINO
MPEVDEDELSDSTRAALRIQEEIDGNGPTTSSKSTPSSRKSSAQVSNGTHGAVTGIALGEYAHKKGGSGTVHIKMKGSKAGFFSESLESLAYRHDSDDEVNPEAPSGSFRQKDLAREASGTGSQAVGLDGKVYSFIEAPSDDESSAERNAPSAVKDKGKSKKKVKKAFPLAFSLTFSSDWPHQPLRRGKRRKERRRHFFAMVWVRGAPGSNKVLAWRMARKRRRKRRERNASALQHRHRKRDNA